jgi:glycosyltransferase involved in cell wall biosynthesis
MKNNKKIKVSLFIPVLPDITGIILELEWFKILTMQKDIEAEIITPTINPEPITNITIQVVKKGVLFPIHYIKMIQSGSPDIIHFEYILGLYGDSTNYFLKSLQSVYYLLSALIVGRILNRKIILSLHKVIIDYPGLVTSDYKIIQILSSLVFRFTNHILSILSDKIVVFTESGQIKLSNLLRVKNKVELMPLPSASDNFEKLKHVKFTFIYYGFIKPNKGLLCLLNAFSRLNLDNKLVKLIVAGGIDPSDNTNKNNSFYEEVAKKISEIKEQFADIESHLNVVSENQLKELMAVSDVVLLPYTDNYLEGSGVASKLLSAGRPLICSNIPRFELFIKNGCALSIMPNNENDLYEKMKLIIQDKELYMKISENCISLSQEYSSRKISEKYLKIYKNLLIKRSYDYDL